ncbi:MAG: polymerase sigma-70 factor, subfamily [Frankiales bacterium]|jgi:RNA polymerase sigma-70 factor (ECF subfamily)|nr:polymerase sigma-70 factor, subfamily [Frankiales bacterium]
MTDTAVVGLDLTALEPYRSELTGYCYRMLGSAFDADDAVQETLVRAWQALDRFEGRSALRSWLYRIATNVCLDALRGRNRRALPMDLSSPVPASTAPVDQLGDEAWLTPIPDADVAPAEGDPASRAVFQETIRLAFVAALQHLPPRQRAVLILREVLCWQASEVATLLGTTVASVNSALQRARATLAARDLCLNGASASTADLAEEERSLLARYVDAFERYDIERLVALLHEDGSISMPPYTMWMQGHAELLQWYVGYGKGCDGSRILPASSPTANGSPVIGQYKPDGKGGHAAWSIQVVEISDGRIAHIHHFLDNRLFARFGLPLTLDQ